MIIFSFFMQYKYIIIIISYFISYEIMKLNLYEIKPFMFLCNSP